MDLTPLLRFLQRRSRRSRGGQVPRVGTRRLSVEPLEVRCLLSASLVMDVNPSGDSSPSALTSVGGTLFFAATDGTSGRELWKSDASGTSMVKDILTGGGSSSPQNLTNVGSVLYFTADDG